MRAMSLRALTVCCLASTLSPACRAPAAPARDVSRASTSHCPDEGAPAWSTPPAWLGDLVSRGLYVRDAGAPVEAPAGDVDVLRGYLTGRDLGPLRDGSRLTLRAARRVYAVNEPVRVVHVVEHTRPGRSLYVMGPKAVTGVRVDGAIDDAGDAGEGDDLAPGEYDGAVLQSPGVDTNFERTVLRFATPGLHRAQWRTAGMTSNTLCIEVR